MMNGVATVKSAVWDLVLTIVLLVGSFAVLVVSAFFDLFAIAFTDYCPQPCQAGTGIAAVFTVWSCSAILALVGAIVAIVRLTRRRRGWWIALIALLLVIIGGIGAFWLYASIIDY
ncbi:MAG TPA: hypothetical protein VHU90_01555 [Galbitalea sp.]|jgi:hypothetical protein|nr:hypothetical protein [Galbitalea sp.]